MAEEKNKATNKFLRKYCGAKGISVIGLDGSYVCGNQNTELWAEMLNAYDLVQNESEELSDGMMQLEIDGEPYVFMKAGDYMVYSHTMYQLEDSMLTAKKIIEGKTIEDIVERSHPTSEEIEVQSRFWRANRPAGDCQNRLGYNKTKKRRYRF